VVRRSASERHRTSSRASRSASAEIDHRRAFHDAPVGQAIASNRVITASNKPFAEIFGGKPSEYTGTTFERLHPSHTHFGGAGLRIGSLLAKEQGVFGRSRDAPS
jgi:hypothetical protein